MSEEKRIKVFEKSDGLCWYCGGEAEQVDHVNPVFLGGSGKLENLVPVCKWCNKSKRGHALEVWRKKLALKAGLAFTDEQKALWGDKLPKEKPYLFYFEIKGIYILDTPRRHYENNENLSWL